MLTIREKRRESRFACHCSARYALFARSVFYDSKIVDYSDAGMRIKSNLPVKIGSTLMVRVTGPWQGRRKDSDFCCPPNRSIGIGQVKWCEKSRDSDPVTYDFGVKFQVP